MSDVIRILLLYLGSFAVVLVLGYYAQHYPWWHEWGAKTVMAIWLLAWVGASVCWISPHIDDNKEK